ncbi:hypothetical protein [Fimbriiglobus ruber]|uniref:Uncharacterized protein n=1 Tax=Fimbriiglobus ruber TaxID=1908690 RepID=A0A225DQ03_9BACT|nr:hypothetical protein [Fimbriiglobus ruber]OWK43530.1 hypothetical protein FRUB_03129 [Fimbriiglobus ruber]
MKFGGNRGQLYDAQKTARARWDSTTEIWNDSTRLEFEQQVWEPLDDAVSGALAAVDQLAVLFTQIRQDCEFSS